MRIVALLLLPVMITIVIFIFTQNDYILKDTFKASDLSSYLIVILTYIYVVFTGEMLRQMVKSNNEQKRPYVIIDIEFQGHIANLILKNIGKMPARNIYVTITPDLYNSSDKKLSDTIFLQPIAFFPPDKEFKTFLNTSAGLLNENTPKEYEFEIRYSWDYAKSEIKDKYKINLYYEYHSEFISQKSLSDVFNEIKSLNESIKLIIKKLT